MTTLCLLIDSFNCGFKIEGWKRCMCYNLVLQYQVTKLGGTPEHFIQRLQSPNQDLTEIIETL